MSTDIDIAPKKYWKTYSHTYARRIKDRLTTGAAGVLGSKRPDAAMNGA
jgi:hypothetical protein